MCALALAGCGGNAGVTATRPVPRAAWSVAVPREVASPTGGVVTLRAPGPDRVRLPAGTFTMGSTEKDLAYAHELCLKEPVGARACTREATLVMVMLRLEREAHPVTLSPFAIDRTEVSVGAYRRCVASGACAPPAFSPGDARFDRDELPVTQVRFQDAAAYCAFAGGRLPTEAEWEYAARGVTGRRFPWGMIWASRRANHGAISATDTTDASDGTTLLAPVESYPDGASPEGVLNLAGNVAEWVNDLVDLQASDERGYAPTPARNPRGAETGEHVIRGGSYRMSPLFLRAPARFLLHGQSSQDDVGFRCAYD